MTLYTQTFIHINTNDNSSPQRTTESRCVSMSFFQELLYHDSLKAYVTKHMTQGSCMPEPPMVSYVEYLCRHVSSL